MTYPTIPLTTLFGYHKDDALYFLGRKFPIIMSQYITEFWEILQRCNGFTKLEAIKNDLPHIHDELFFGLMDMGLREGIIVDAATGLLTQFHLDSCNPTTFAPEITQEQINQLIERKRPRPIGLSIAKYSPTDSSTMFNLVKNRRSVRSFNSEIFTAQTLSTVLGHSYMVEKSFRPTPSAGKTYPLRIFAVSGDPGQELYGQLHEWDAVNGELVRLNQTIDSVELARALDQPKTPKGVLVIICADLNIPVAKYGNRAYRYALIETGQVAQNLNLAAIEAGAGIVEYGGFEDEELAKLLNLDFPNSAPLLTTILGYEASHSTPDISNDHTTILQEFTSAYVGVGKPIDRVEVHPLSTTELRIPKVRALASYRLATAKPDSKPKARHTTSGVSTCTAVACIKAIAEGYERHVCGMVNVDIVASANELTSSGLSFADPARFTPYKPEQLKYLHDVAPFDMDSKYEWVKGIRNGSLEPVFVPTDLVYYPIPRKGAKRKPLHYSSSNGVAAHTNLKTAQDKGLMELIERDALMVLWYSQREVFSLPHSALPDEVSYRANFWRRHGWELKLIDATTDSLPVCLAIIWSKNRYPHFAAGASCALTIEEAASKAIEEAETLLRSTRGSSNKKIPPEKVTSVMDHGRFYFRHDGLPYVNWLINSKERAPQKKNYDLEMAWEKFNPILLTLAESSSTSPLHVVRVLSDILMPINFGHGTEHLDHPRLKMLGLEWKREYPSTPHFFA